MLSFPNLLRPVSGGYVPFARTLGGGQSLSGIEQVVSTMSDRWQARFAFPANRTERLLALRAFVVGMRGRANTVALPVFDRGRAPWAVDAYGRTLSATARRSRALDGTVYADPAGLVDSLIDIRLAAAAAAMDPSIDVVINTGSLPTVGQFFSIGTRLYMVQAVSGAGPVSIEIWPWLRLAAPAGTAVNFTSPVCEMRFQTDTEGADALKALDQMRFGNVTVNFDEAAPT